MAGKVLAVVVVFAFLLAGCGANGAAAYLAQKYPLVDVVPSRYGGDEARVYRIDAPVKETADTLSKLNKPEEISQENQERMVLVYPEYVIDIYDQDGTTMAEVASLQYVRDHYDSGGFFRGYLAASVIRDIFGGPRSFGWGGQVYTGREAVPSYGKTVREGSVGAPTIRGGGIFAGK